MRETLSDWKAWMIVAYVGLAGLTVYGWTISARTQQEQSRRQAATAAAVQSCIQSRPQVERVSRHVYGVNQLALVLVENSAAVLDATPTSDPQYEVRKKNLTRLIKARENVAAIKSFPVPTVAQCRARGGQ